MLGIILSLGCMKQDVPPAGEEEVIYRPTGKVYPRRPQVVNGVRQAAKFDVIETTTSTIADAAQIYADFSGKEVRVPRNLAAREFRRMGGAAADFVVRNLEWQLPAAGVDIAPSGDRVVLFRAGKSAAERSAALRPAMATAAQLATAEKAMSVDRFWMLVEGARRTSGNDGMVMAMALQASLGRLSADEIFGFHLRLNERLDESYRWDLWAVAYIVNGGASDDGFEYFRGWLIAQGRQYFEAALKDPSRAADRAGAAYDNENEQILYAAMGAYEAKTGKPPPVPPSRRGPEPAGKRWEEKDLPGLFPELVKRFL